MMGWGNGWGAGWGLYGLVHLLWWALLILGIIALARWLFFGAHGVRRADEDRALAILRERYARGDIDKTEFDARKRDLG